MRYSRTNREWKYASNEISQLPGIAFGQSVFVKNAIFRLTYKKSFEFFFVWSNDAAYKNVELRKIKPTKEILEKSIFCGWSPPK